MERNSFISKKWSYFVQNKKTKTLIKALFFDIDGTLVSFKTHSIPQSTIDAIHKVRQQGVKVFIATGRPMPFVNNLDGLEYDGIMSVNGAYSAEADGTLIHRNVVDKDDIRRIIEHRKEHPMPIVFASESDVFSVDCEAAAEAVQEVFDLLNLTFPAPRPIEEALKMDVLQVIAFFDKEAEPYIMSEVLKGCEAFRWHPAFADCIVRGTSKAIGIDRICEYYGFDISETMAFGDGGNDIEMLQHAGLSVAMGNATDAVKQYADAVTDSVDDDGIAKALERFKDRLLCI